MSCTSCYNDRLGWILHNDSEHLPLVIWSLFRPPSLGWLIFLSLQQRMKIETEVRLLNVSQNKVFYFYSLSLLMLLPAWTKKIAADRGRCVAYKHSNWLNFKSLSFKSTPNVYSSAFIKFTFLVCFGQSAKSKLAVDHNDHVSKYHLTIWSLRLCPSRHTVVQAAIVSWLS